MACPTSALSHYLGPHWSRIATQDHPELSAETPSAEGLPGQGCSSQLLAHRGPESLGLGASTSVHSG